MIYRIKEALQVKVYNIVVAIAYYIPRFTQSMMTALAGAETIAAFGKLTLINGHQ